MFTQVRLSNFKSLYGEHSIDLRRISVFIGPNGAGKSSVLQALLLLRQSLGQGTVITDRDFINLGNPDDLSPAPDLRPRLGITTVEHIVLPHLNDAETPVRVEAKIDASVVGDPDVMAEFNSQPLTLVTRRDGNNRVIDPPQYKRDGNQMQFAPDQSVTKGIRINSYSGDMQLAVEDVNNLLGIPNVSLTNTRYVPPLRGFSEARYGLGNAMVTDFASRIAPNYNASVLATSLAYDEELRVNVSDVLRALTGVTVGDELIPDKRIAPVSLRPTATGTRKVVPTNEGFGTNQLVHLIAQTLVAPSEGTILIEEPETHLHPSAQAKLGMWIADHAIENSKQFLITTHSERFLAALLWQTRKEVLTPADLIVHYFALNEDGHTNHRKLDVTHGGLIQGSFQEFFGQPEDMPEWDEFYRGL